MEIPDKVNRYTVYMDVYTGDTCTVKTIGYIKLPNHVVLARIEPPLIITKETKAKIFKLN